MMSAESFRLGGLRVFRWGGLGKWEPFFRKIGISKKRGVQGTAPYGTTV